MLHKLIELSDYINVYEYISTGQLELVFKTYLYTRLPACPGSLLGVDKLGGVFCGGGGRRWLNEQTTDFKEIQIILIHVTN